MTFMTRVAVSFLAFVLLDLVFDAADDIRKIRVLLEDRDARVKKVSASE